MTYCNEIRLLKNVPNPLITAQSGADCSFILNALQN